MGAIACVRGLWSQQYAMYATTPVFADSSLPGNGFWLALKAVHWSLLCSPSSPSLHLVSQEKTGIALKLFGLKNCGFFSSHFHKMGPLGRSALRGLLYTPVSPPQALGTAGAGRGREEVCWARTVRAVLSAHAFDACCLPPVSELALGLRLLGTDYACRLDDGHNNTPGVA